MKLSRRATLCGAALFVGGAPFAWGCEEPAKYKFTTQRKDDRVDVVVEKERTRFDVRSAVGITRIEIDRLGAAWPERVALRLHLAGLESFSASNGDVTLSASVSSTEKTTSVRVGKEDQGEGGSKPVDPKGPYAMEVRMVGADGKPAAEIPLRDGYFEMQLPKAFFKENPKSITLRMVDFYRN